jgi:dethiobiotin synthetase
MQARLGGAGVFVTGTDTGVGKTLVSAGLVRALTGERCRVAGLKPVVSGMLETEANGRRDEPASNRWSDLEVLANGGGVGLSAEERSVYRLREATAPQFAAAAEGVLIERSRLMRELTVTRARLEFAVIEGVGGFRVPLGVGFDTADLAAELGLPVVLVVGLRLGCINHALLTAEAIRARGLTLAAWVANAGIDAGYAQVEQTVAALEATLGLAVGARLPMLCAVAGQSRAEAMSGEAGQGGVDDGRETQGVSAQIDAAAHWLAPLAHSLRRGIRGA